jgi:hypothetical protein
MGLRGTQLRESKAASEKTAHSPEIGRRLRQHREAAGLTLSGLATVSAGEFRGSCVGAYERCERALPIGRAERLAALYGVNLVTLLAGEVVHTVWRQELV